MSRDKRIEEMAKDLLNVSKKVSNIIMEETHEFVSQNHRYNSLKDFHEAHPKSRCQMEAEFLTELGYRKIYDDLQRQCTCYALGCQMAEELEKKVAKKFIEAVDSMMECVCAMTGLPLTYYGEYAELKKKYESEKDK